MLSKAHEIRKLLEQGKTTREIARELRVSLRDIHRVRQQENIDFDALNRQKRRLEKEQATLDTGIAQRREDLARLDGQISNLQQTLTRLEAEIQQKKKQIQYVKQPVEYIYFPENYNEVANYLETLNDKQLQSIFTLTNKIIMRRAYRAIDDEVIRIRHESDEILRRAMDDAKRLLGGS